MAVGWLDGCIGRGIWLKGGGHIHEYLHRSVMWDAAGYNIGDHAFEEYINHSFRQV